MSKVTKRKHVMKEMDADFFDPPTPNQQIVRIICSRGNNLHEVESATPIHASENSDSYCDNGEAKSLDKFLVSMPTKFRKNVWVKRGDFVIVEPIEEGDKVKGEIVRILTPQQIKQFSKDGIWPEKFSVKNSSHAVQDSDTSSDSESDDDIFRNPNRMHHNKSDSESES